MDNNFQPIWPNLQRDRLAMERAMQELGESAPIRELLIRAQQIKESLPLAS